ncbi:hypothetical protein LTR47_002784 [Exophiala xenobiotica]|nr:hypothetical protein LTR92_004870 [Exophiala xenobiotica]KAK5209892.1 hypothetical protein LTR41_004524 [Exophiala xenobiotica]KAK5236058.1 hypothetical protein LTR47_002784 [Exophiala xenobiotica]KAK5253766.1 hypothetical protein LTS06_001895 [Exophiala xenobiotica]KAK5351629.1 hypothetical protein LTR61_004979 [Exophiala xenobiotica]
MPPWGRPPRGGRQGKKNDRLWEMQQRQWEYDARVEELDADDDYSQGFGLDQERFTSDELRFTGIDLGGNGARRRRSGTALDDDFTPSEDEDEDEYDYPTGLTRQSDMQMVYRDKEDMLVRTALERIARARALGKPNVKLTRAEIDALERLERTQPPPRPSAAPKAAPKSKKEAQVRRKPVETRKKPSKPDKSASHSPKGKRVDGRSRGRSVASSSSAREGRDDLVNSYALPASESDYGRRVSHSQGFYVAGPRQAEPVRQGSRTNSNQSLRQQQHLQQVAPYYPSRYASNPEAVYAAGSSRAPRPDPSEPDWEPRARSTSSLVNVPLDHLPYQTNTGRAPRFDPNDPRFASPQRRVASGPPALPQNQTARYRRPQDELFLPGEEPEVMRYLAPPSDSEDEEEEDDDDSDYDEGVRVNVNETPDGGYSVQTRSGASSARKTATHGKGTAGKTRKGR